jgi:fructokinase
MAETIYEHQAKVLVFGEILFDQFVRGDSQIPEATVLGGAPTNFAYHLQRNLNIECQIVSAVGNSYGDGLGPSALKKLKHEQLDVSLVQSNNKWTGLVPVTITGNDHSFEILKDRAFDYIEFNPQIEKAAQSASLIYFGTLAQRMPVSRETLTRILDAGENAIKFCDINLRKDCYTPTSVIESIRRANIIKLNDQEVVSVLNMLESKVDLASINTPAEIGKKLFDAIKERFEAKLLIVTQGSRGALAFSVDGELAYHPGFEIVQASNADTVGSGDAFSAGFIKSYLSQQPLYECIKLGNKMGALVACERGAICKVDLAKVLPERNLIEVPATEIARSVEIPRLDS